jgi:hypothetical protein
MITSFIIRNTCEINGAEIGLRKRDQVHVAARDVPGARSVVRLTIHGRKCFILSQHRDAVEFETTGARKHKSIDSSFCRNLICQQQVASSAF